MNNYYFYQKNIIIELNTVYQSVSPIRCFNYKLQITNYYKLQIITNYKLQIITNYKL